MCKFLSGVITKKETLFEFDSDSHEEIIKKHKLNDKTREPDFVRVELVPKDNNIFNHDMENWVLQIDQDYKPEWFSLKFSEAEMKKALKQIIDERFIIDCKVKKEIRNQRVFIKNSSVVAWENSSVEAWGNSSVEAMGNSSVVARGNSSVVARGNSSVVARENSQILLPYDYPVKIKGVYDFATVKDITHNKIIVANDFKIEKFK